MELILRLLPMDLFPSSRILCVHCHKATEEPDTFNCEFCAEEEQKYEFLICSTCSRIHHAFHMSCVKPTAFADEKSRTRVSHLLNDLDGLTRLRDAVSIQLRERVTQELDRFFHALEVDSEGAKVRARKLIDTTTITEDHMGRISKKVAEDAKNIDKKMQQLEAWKKKFFQSLAELNSIS
uniref:PHD domain-containing protein n=1 Tax=Steinernema glaseri TaxID=37863 RepID=A0A1I8AU81_9BILA